MGKSPLSRAEAEAQGWVIVHEDEGQEQYRAEKYLDSNTKIEAVGMTEGLLLESMAAYGDWQDSLEPPAPMVVDMSVAPTDEAGAVLRPVIGPEGERFTDAEWSARDSGYEPAAEAGAAMQEIGRDAEDKAKADPRGELDVEQIEQESLRDHQLEEVLVVQEGETSLSEAVDRNLEQKAQAESERVDAGLGIGPYVEGDEPMGGPSEPFDPTGLPAAVPQEPVEEAPAEEAPVEEAPAEAETETEVMNATGAAVELAAANNVDLNQVEGTGADGKITKPDVEAAIEAQG